MKKIRLFLSVIALVLRFGIPAGASVLPYTGQNLSYTNAAALPDGAVITAGFRDISYQITMDATGELSNSYVLPAASYLVARDPGLES